MAFSHEANTIVCDAGPNTIPGPIDIVGIHCGGSVTIAKDGNTLLTLAAGTHDFELRSGNSLVITGACTLFLRLSTHS